MWIFFEFVHVCIYKFSCKQDTAHTCNINSGKKTPKYNKAAADDFENIRAKTCKMSVNKSMYNCLTKVGRVETYKNIVANGDLTYFKQFHLLTQSYQKSSVAEPSESIWFG